MICFAAVVPHNPQLLTHSRDQYIRTLAAVEQIGELLVTQQPDAVVFISAHAHEFSKFYTLQFGTSFSSGSQLKQFGIIKNESYSGALDIMSKIQSCARQFDIPMRTIHSESLKLDSAVAAKLLHISTNIPVAIVGTCERSIIDHVEFGYFLKDILHNSEKRVAIIVTGDGHSAADTEDTLLNSVIHRSVANLGKAVRIAHSDDCVIQPLACSYGLLRGFPVETKVLSHETIGDLDLVSAILYSD